MKKVLLIVLVVGLMAGGSLLAYDKGCGDGYYQRRAFEVSQNIDVELQTLELKKINRRICRLKNIMHGSQIKI